MGVIFSVIVFVDVIGKSMLHFIWQVNTLTYLRQHHYEMQKPYASALYNWIYEQLKPTGIAWATF